MEEEPCNTRLALAIGGGVEDDFDRPTRGRQRKLPIRFSVLFPPCAAGQEEDQDGEKGGWSSTTTAEESRGRMNKIRLRRTSSTEEKLGGAADGGGGDGEGGGGGCRKKLRLTQDQSALLETIFRQHSILTAMQKQELADRLNLRPRQVEVWFQNRRARTKLKQTEVDCEFLKRCCESLSDENTRLRKELQELRTTCRPAAPAPFVDAYLIPRGAAPAGTVTTVCPSCCERVVVAAGVDDGKGEGVVDGAAKCDCTVKDGSIAC